MNKLSEQEAQVRRNDRTHVFHSWSAQSLIDPMPIARADGTRFYDYQGNGYLDFASQLVNVNLGHQHPKVVAAIKQQADKLCTIAPGFANDVRGQLAAMIADRAPGDLNTVFFTNGGTDANEHAMRMAKLHTGRPKILSTYRSYHGATAASITATGDPRRWANDPGTPGIVHFFGPYPYRSAFGATSESAECELALKHLEEVIVLEGATTVAGILLETIVGTNGVLIPPEGYLAGVRALCDKYGLVLICDEVMVGFGRVGEWFACQRWDITPDLITFAKGINSGYVPLGGVLVSSSIANTFANQPYPGGLTYSGHPLACAAGVASINVFEDEGLLGHVRQLGESVVGPMLHDLAERHPSVGEVRGLGLMWALELIRNRETRQMLVPFNASGPDAEPMTNFAATCKTNGLWPFTHFNRVHIVPTLIINEAELKEGIAVIDEALSGTDAYVD